MISRLLLIALAALGTALNIDNDSEADRRARRREARIKGFREWVTIALLLGTAWLVYGQWREM